MVLSVETPVLTIVNGETGQVAGKVSLANPVEVGSLSSDRSTLFLAEDGTSPGELLALDTRSFQVRWSEAQSTTLQPRFDRWNGVAVAAYGSIAPTSDGKRLYVTPAWRESDKLGVAVLDGGTRNLIAFGADPLGVGWQGLIIVPPTSTAPQGTLLATGARDLDAVPVVDWLFEIDPNTLAVVDSSSVVAVPNGGSRYLLNPVIAPDSRYVYLIGVSSSGNLYKYDVSTRQVVASAPGQSLILAISPDGRTIYQPRPSSGPGTPASLVMYDESLNIIARIDLPDIDGVPPVLQNLAISPDGSRVYLTAGTGSAVVDGGTQRGHLIAVDPASRRVLWTIPLGIWAPSQVFVR